MGIQREAYWPSNSEGQTRKERAGGTYQYYVPTLLEKLDISLASDVVSDVVRAESAIRDLNNSVKSLQSTEGLARLLLRAESVSSSYIEGLHIGTRRLLKAELNLAARTSSRTDATAVEILGNIHAMERALERAESSPSITVDTIKDIHRTLLANSRIEQYGGVVRQEQNWVGGNWHNPLQAEFVPPAPELVDELLVDLAKYCNQDLISPVQQAAIAHAQFETIHPFVDGNGRTGRALIHLILRRRGLTRTFVPPISLVLATFSRDYIQGLTDFRSNDQGDTSSTLEGINEWLSFFAGSCVRACNEASKFEESAAVLQHLWRNQIGSVRKGSTAELLMSTFIGMPVFTLESLCKATGRSLRAVTEAVESFISAGIVKPCSSGKRKRVFEVPSVLREFNILERRLASPAGDTRTEKPVRPVPFKS